MESVIFSYPRALSLSLVHVMRGTRTIDIGCRQSGTSILAFNDIISLLGRQLEVRAPSCKRAPASLVAYLVVCSSSWMLGYD
jgi:hypothetical protein